MLLYPAIDLMNGQAVRLKRGEAEEKTVYSNNPAEMALRWEASGGDWIHIVDLDAAFSGESRNLSQVENICRAVNVPCQLGGGIRSLEAAEAAFAAGVSRVIIGTRASESIAFVKELSERFGSNRIAVGIDAKNGYVAVKGWTQSTLQQASDLAAAAEVAGAGTIIYTDIATDGMLQGPNFSEVEKMVETVRCDVISSGGVSCMDDLRKLDKIPGLHGAIIGKALYDGKITGNMREQLGENPGN